MGSVTAAVNHNTSGETDTHLAQGTIVPWAFLLGPQSTIEIAQDKGFSQRYSWEVYGIFIAFSLPVPEIQRQWFESLTMSKRKTKISMPIGSLVLLSGAPGAGKSTACQDLPAELVLSSDTLRQTLFGTSKTVVDGQVAERPLATDDRLIFSTMETVVQARLKAGLTTVVDATLISDKERKPFATVAAELGVAVQVVILNPPLEQVQRQNKQRRCVVPEAVVAKFCDRLQTNSQWPFTLVEGDAKLSVHIPTIPDTAKLDVIGDVHGLVDTLHTLLKKLGYDDELTHPEGRHLC